MISLRRKLPATLIVAGCSAPSMMDAGDDDAGRCRVGIDVCRTDGGTDAGYDAGRADAGADGGPMDAGACDPNGSCTPYLNACGMNCGCLTEPASDGGLDMLPYCDPDIGNPCSLGCFNPLEADGGRRYLDDAGTPVCYC